MDEFIDEEIEVTQSATSPAPAQFRWRQKVHEVLRVLRVRVDTGFGLMPRRSRKWFARRHRRYYLVEDHRGDIFELYLDYSDRKHPRWVLARKLASS